MLLDNDFVRVSRVPAEEGLKEDDKSDRVIVWKVDRLDGASFNVIVPREPGRYVLSVVKMTDDGDVGTASLPVTVQ